MGEYRSRSNNISRQFTEAESAVSERVTNHLTQQVDELPPARMRQFGTSHQVYGWLEEDLKRRDESTRRLANEFALAEEQSIRYKLDREATDEIAQKDQASNVLGRVARWNELGYGSPDEAKQAAMFDDPSLATNPHAISGLGQLVGGYKSDAQRKSEELSTKYDVIKKTEEIRSIEGNLAWMEANPGKGQEMINAANDAQYMNTLSEPIQARVRQAASAQSWKDAQKNIELFGNINGPDPSEESIIAARGVMKRNGVEVPDMTGLFSRIKPDGYISKMLANSLYMGGMNEGNKAQVQDAANLVASKETPEPERLKAMATLQEFAGYFASENQPNIEIEENKKRMDVLGKEARSTYEKVNEANNKLLIDSGDDRSGVDPSIFSSAMVENAKTGISSIRNMFQGNKEEYDAAIKELDQALKDTKFNAKEGKFGVDSKYADDVYVKVNQITNRYMSAMIEANPKREVTTPDPAGDLETTKDTAPAKKGLITKTQWETFLKEASGDSKIAIDRATKEGFTLPSAPRK